VLIHVCAHQGGAAGGGYGSAANHGQWYGGAGIPSGGSDMPPTYPQQGAGSGGDNFGEDPADELYAQAQNTGSYTSSDLSHPSYPGSNQVQHQYQQRAQDNYGSVGNELEVLPEIISSGTGFGVGASNSTGSSGSSGSSNLLFGSDLSQVDKDFIFEGLKKLYKKKVLPLEIASKYSHFSSPPLGPSDFEAKPMVLILGQVRFGVALAIYTYTRAYELTRKALSRSIICIHE
jgi:N-terminal EH-domain containing protein